MNHLGLYCHHVHLDPWSYAFPQRLGEIWGDSIVCFVVEWKDRKMVDVKGGCRSDARGRCIQFLAVIQLIDAKALTLGVLVTTRAVILQPVEIYQIRRHCYSEVNSRENAPQWWILSPKIFLKDSNIYIHIFTNQTLASASSVGLFLGFPMQ